jgi:hypothetical protein
MGSRLQAARWCGRTLARQPDAAARTLQFQDLPRGFGLIDRSVSGTPRNIGLPVGKPGSGERDRRPATGRDHAPAGRVDPPTTVHGSGLSIQQLLGLSDTSEATQDHPRRPVRNGDLADAHWFERWSNIRLHA